MKDLGATKQILGMRITRDREVLKLSQEEYMKKVLSRFNMARAPRPNMKVNEILLFIKPLFRLIQELEKFFHI